MSDEYFTFSCYKDIISTLKGKSYSFSNFSNSVKSNTVFLRHDVDFSVRIARRFAEMENRLGVSSTYFVMLNTPVYNVMHSETRALLHEMIDMGHDIGLHYVLENEEVKEGVQRECDLLQDLLENKVSAYSFHRPAYWSNKGFDPSAITILDRLNVHQFPFFGAGSYISDSNHHWRCGDPVQFVSEFEGEYLQILTHPIWWVEFIANSLNKVEDCVWEIENVAANYYIENITCLKSFPKFIEKYQVK